MRTRFKLADGLSAEQIASVTQPAWRSTGELAFSEHGRLPDRAHAGLPGTTDPQAQHRAPEENPEGFVLAVREFLESLQPAENCEVCQ